MDKFVVLSMSGESKDVAKALSNDTAISIMNKLAEKRMSASELSKTLKIPISTTQYNLDLLKQVGLIQDTAYRYSEKGKKVLYYEPAKKFIILAPEKEKASILNLLKNKLMVPLILGVSAATGFLGQTLFGSSASFGAQTAASKMTMDAAVASEVTSGASCIMADTTPFYQMPGFIFFLGALFATIAIFVAYRMSKK